jgi:hypothetical protein
MQPGRSTAVAIRSVRMVTWLIPDVGVKCRSPTI